jgi:hypothetical protein
MAEPTPYQIEQRKKRKERMDDLSRRTVNQRDGVVPAAKKAKKKTKSSSPGLLERAMDAVRKRPPPVKDGLAASEL